MAHAIPCPCGRPSCKNWLVEPQAAWQGVSFTKEQAEAVATLLNGAVLIPITDRQICDMLVGAIESSGMTRAWCAGIFWGQDGESDPPTDTEGVWYGDAKLLRRPDYMLTVNEFIDESKAAVDGNIKAYFLDRAALVKGFQVMAEKSPYQFAAFMQEVNADEVTYDVWLQCAVLGDVVYG